MTGNRSNNGRYIGDTKLRILTNMAFWQSERWFNSADSIHRDHGRAMNSEPAWWKQAWSMFLQSGHYDVVISLGVRESMAYGLLCLLAGRDARQIMTEVFIDEPHRTPVWLVKTWLYRRLARRALGILTNSSAEIETMAERYRIARARLRFVPLNSTLAGEAKSDLDDGFILSAGRTLRDYPALLEAVQGIDIRTIIISGHDDALPDPLPAGVTQLKEISFADYVDHIRRCTLLALPLRPTGRSTGQVVMLDAMALGKPVVVTRNAGTIDYIRDGENGILVEPGDISALRNAITRLLADRALRNRLGDRAFEDVQTLYSFDTHARLKLQAVSELYRTKHPETP